MLILQKSLKTTFASFAIFSMVFSAISFSGATQSVETKAAYNSAASRYEDTLNTPHQVAVYNYNYENTAPEEAYGYFDIALETLIGAAPKDLYRIVEIKETYPIDFTTFQPLSGATVRNINPADALYYEGNTLRIRVVPQNECVKRPQGGCEDLDSRKIPAGVPGQLQIRLALSPCAPVTSSISDGQGKIYFPNGFDVNAIGWRVTAQHQPASNVLKDCQTGGVNTTITGPNGTAPVQNNPVTITTGGLVATNGNPLNAPDGTCKTTINGIEYTGTGIVNGVCVITIPNIGTTSQIPAGTITVSDGGNPVPVVIDTQRPTTNINPDTVNCVANPTDPSCLPAVDILGPEDIPNIGTGTDNDFFTDVVCDGDNTVNANAGTTSCVLTIKPNKQIPADFQLGIGKDPAGSCTQSNNTVTCVNVPVTTTTGQQPLIGKIGTTTANTGKTITVEATNNNPIIPTITVTPQPRQIPVGANISFVGKINLNGASAQGLVCEYTIKQPSGVVVNLTKVADANGNCNINIAANAAVSNSSFFGGITANAQTITSGSMNGFNQRIGTGTVQIAATYNGQRYQSTLENWQVIAAATPTVRSGGALTLIAGLIVAGAGIGAGVFYKTRKKKITDADVK